MPNSLLQKILYGKRAQEERPGTPIDPSTIYAVGERR
jgi:hypothetical protein